MHESTTSLSRGRRTLLWIGALSLVCLVGATLGELMVRALWPAGGRYYIWPPRLAVSFDPDPRFVPGVAPVAHLKVNREGALGPELQEPKRNEYRILTIGGSTTECIMLDQSKTWPARVEQALARTADGRRVRIANLGRAGFNSRDHLGAMRLVVGQYHADAVIVQLGGNDMLDCIGLGGAYDPYFVEDEPRYRKWLLSRFALVPLSAQRSTWYEHAAIWQLARSLKVILRDSKYIQMDREGRWLADARLYRQRAALRDELPPLEAALDEYRRNVRALAAEARRRSLRIVFVTQPAIWKDTMTPAENALLWMGAVPARPGERQQWQWWDSNAPGELYSTRALRSAMDRYNQALLQVCAQINVECVDVAAHLPRTSDIYFDDVHYTEEGARQLAGEVVAYLKTTAPFGNAPTLAARP